MMKGDVALRLLGSWGWCKVVSRRVVVLDQAFGNVRAERAVAEQHGADFAHFQCRTVTEARAAAHGADVVFVNFAPVDHTVLEAVAPGGLVIRYGVGYDNVDTAAARALNVRVANVPDYGIETVADHTVAALLSGLRRTHQYDRLMKERVWVSPAEVGDIASFDETTIGLIGAGRIAQQVALRLQPFGFTIQSYDPAAPADAFGTHVHRTSLEAVLCDSDAVSLHCPLTAETHHMINAEVLANVRHGMYLVNTARGGLIDTGALTEALQTGHISGAAIDVFETEPLDEHSPLRSCENVVLSPHAAFYSGKSMRNLQQLAADEAGRALRHEPLRCPIVDGPAGSQSARRAVSTRSDGRADVVPARLDDLQVNELPRLGGFDATGRSSCAQVLNPGRDERVSLTQLQSDPIDIRLGTSTQRQRKQEMVSTRSHRSGHDAQPLDGQWRFRRDEQLRGEMFPEELHITHQEDSRWMRPTYDDSGWGTMPVPACIQEELPSFTGVSWYRHEFTVDATEGSARYALRFDAVDYIGDFWLNGFYLGSHEGYFDAVEFDVTDFILIDEPNLLAVRVDGSPDVPGFAHERDQLKYQLKGTLARADHNNPDVVSSGIWRSVWLIRTGAVRIGAVDHHAQPVLSRPAQPNQRYPAILDSKVSIDCSGTGRLTAISTLSLRGNLVSTATTEIDLTPGLRDINIRHSPLNDIELWWTWDWGNPTLYRVDTIIKIDGRDSDASSDSIGFREINSDHDGCLTLNGHRFFQRGTNYLSEQLLSMNTTESYRRDLYLMIRSNLNTVHPFGVVERPDFYDLCDELGVLVYQDFCVWLQATDDSEFVRRAVPQVRSLIREFSNHPSIAIWNFGSQPSFANAMKLCRAMQSTAKQLDRTRISRLANATLSQDGREFLHPRLSFFWTSDQAHYMSEHQRWDWDTHCYAGWYWGQPNDVRALPPEELRLVTEFGAQGLPSVEVLVALVGQERSFPPDWSEYSKYCCQPHNTVPRLTGQHNDLDQFVQDSQRLQANVIKTHIEHYRVSAFAPCQGAHLFIFNDCWPAITWSVVDHDRRPKLAYQALTTAMSPLQTFLDLSATDSAENATFDIVVVNSLLAPQTLDITIDFGTTHQHKHEEVRVPANTVSRIGQVDINLTQIGTVVLSTVTTDQPPIMNSYPPDELAERIAWQRSHDAP